MAAEFWGQKSFVLITGASQGIGQSIAIEFAKNVAPDSAFLLIARNEGKLQETKSLIAQVSPQIHVHIRSWDLAKLDKENYESTIRDAVGAGDPSSFDQAIIVHNAASFGDITIKLSEQEDQDSLQTEYNVNVISMILLTSIFLRVFNAPSKQRAVINLSSLVAKVPTKNLGVYGGIKANRELLIKTLAAEETNLIALSYLPGVVDTEMSTLVRTALGDEETRRLFQSIRELGNIVQPSEVGKHLVQVLKEREFANGGFVDFFEHLEEYHPSFKGLQRSS